MMAMKDIRRFFLLASFVALLHVYGLLVLSAFRFLQYSVLGYMITDAKAEVLPAFLRGLWFDNVVGCYILVLPLVVLFVAAVFGCYHRALRRGAAIWFGVLYMAVFAVSAANVPYFQYFFKNINSGIFEWFGYAETTAGMVIGEKSYIYYIAAFFFASGGYASWVYFAERRFSRMIASAPADGRSLSCVAIKLAATVAVAGLCVLGIRGRLGYNPIKVSEAYYCNDPFLNQLGISPAFNLLTSSLDDMRKENRELKLMPYSEAVEKSRKYLGCDTVLAADSVNVLRRHISAAGVVSEKPNVVIILMESMSAAFMSRSGLYSGLTPVLDSIYDNSLAFANFYSAGIHTNHGLMASLYSFPALMKRNLMKGTVTPRKTGIPTVLKANGWHNMFFMTHEAQYDNMNAFLRTNGYDDVFSQENYPTEEVVNSFGVSDRFLFRYAIDQIDRACSKGKPFMATLLTVSNHPPYVIPDWFHPASAAPETQIVEYADRSVGEFLNDARQREWYGNTVFVLMADHGKIVGNVDSELPQSYNHIPLMMFGPGIEHRVYSGLGMQVDFMPTLLSVLGISYDYDGFGHNLLSEHRDKVFYSADDQIVARDSSGFYIYYPGSGRGVCYETPVGGGQPRETGMNNRFAALKDYAFSMIQTAEYIYRRQK